MARPHSLAFGAGRQFATKPLPRSGVVQLNQVAAAVGNGKGVGAERRNRKLRGSRKTTDDENR